MSSVGQFGISSSIEMDVPSMSICHSTLFLLSPSLVPHPQGPPSPYTVAITVASPFQFVMGRLDGAIGVLGGAGAGEPSARAVGVMGV